jgi:multidrug efflux pump subunit AcrA (membrane-fusion protein)
LAGIGLVTLGVSFGKLEATSSSANWPARESDDESLQFRIPAKTDGIVDFLGQQRIPGDDKTETRLFEVQIAGRTTTFRQLRPGDLVEQGQVIGRINDELLSTELRITKAKLASAEAEMASSNKTKEEAYRRWQEAKKLMTSKSADFSRRDIDGRELTYNRYARELDAKMAAIDVIKREIEKVTATLDAHLIRSSVRGVVRRVHKHPGEAVRKLETVVTLQIVNDDSK